MSPPGHRELLHSLFLLCCCFCFCFCFCFVAAKRTPEVQVSHDAANPDVVSVPEKTGTSFVEGSGNQTMSGSDSLGSYSTPITLRQEPALDTKGNRGDDLPKNIGSLDLESKEGDLVEIDPSDLLHRYLGIDEGTFGC